MKISGSKPFCSLLHLRVRESEPNLLHLVAVEEAVYDFNARAKKGHIGQLLLQRELGSRPHACAFDVYTDEVHVGIEPGQPHRVLAFAAAQLQHDGVVVVKVFVAPVAFHRERHVVDHREGIFKHVAHLLHFRKLGEFSFSHDSVLWC